MLNLTVYWLNYYKRERKLHIYPIPNNYYNRMYNVYDIYFPYCPNEKSE